MSPPTKYRDRKFCGILYPEDNAHTEAIEKLKVGGYNFAAILHDKDLHEDGEHKGELKKPHWHIVIKFSNAVWNTSVCKDLGIAENYLESAKSLDSALLYLVHDGYEDKHQYELAEVFGPLQTRLASLLRDDDESTRALTIYNLIANSPGIVTYTEIFTKACKSGLYGDFRRMGSGVVYLIKEHNEEFYAMTQRNTGVVDDMKNFEEYLRWTSARTSDIGNIDGLAPFKGGRSEK